MTDPRSSTRRDMASRAAGVAVTRHTGTAAVRFTGLPRRGGEFPVASPHPRAQAVERVIADLHGVRFILEGRDGQYRAEDLLLEDPHLVVALEHGRLEVVSARQ